MSEEKEIDKSRLRTCCCESKLKDDPHSTSISCAWCGVETPPVYLPPPMTNNKLADKIRKIFPKFKTPGELDAECKEMKAKDEAFWEEVKAQGGFVRITKVGLENLLKQERRAMIEDGVKLFGLFQKQAIMKGDMFWHNEFEEQIMYLKSKL